MTPLAAQQVSTGERLLTRRYTEGSHLRYRMTGRDGPTAYEVTIAGTTLRRPDGQFVDEFAWSDMVVNGTPRVLAPSSQALRVAVTLEGGTPFEVPDLGEAPGLVGPVTDLLTFYADLFLAMHQGALRLAGDRFSFTNPRTASWADGKVVILGEDHIDFEVALSAVDTDTGVATLLIKHIPPASPTVRLPAEWMHAAVSDTPNNWVMVRKTQAGFAASVGKETFDVVLRISTADGHILSGTLDNPVTKITRDCSDAALTTCGEARPDPTLRHIEMSLLPD